MKRLCGDSRLGGEGAEIHVWRTAQDATTVLELRANPSARRITLYYDSAGRQLLSMPSAEAVPRGSDLGRNLDRQRASILADLKEAETMSCGGPH